MRGGAPEVAEGELDLVVRDARGRVDAEDARGHAAEDLDLAVLAVASGT